MAMAALEILRIVLALGGGGARRVFARREAVIVVVMIVRVIVMIVRLCRARAERIRARAQHAERRHPGLALARLLVAAVAARLGLFVLMMAVAGGGVG